MLTVVALLCASCGTREPAPRIAAFSVAKSPTLSVHAGDAITVTGEAGGNSEFNFTTAVYGADGVLAAKEDDETASDAFRWTVTHDGAYYVLMRNASPVTGSYKIAIAPGQSRGGSENPNDYARVKVFYATNRQKTGETAPAKFFGTEPAADDSLTLGTCEVSIPRDHRMGELEAPSIWKLEFKADPAKHVVLERVIDEEREAFFRDISARAGKSMRREAFVFIHGFNTTFEDAARRTAQISYDLAFDGAPIFFSWPSQAKLDPVNYQRDGRNAELSVPVLKNFLEQLASKTRATTIHVIAHSMGNRVLAASLREIARSNTPHFRQIALMAPDVDAVTFGKMADAIRKTADRVTLYASSRDEALIVSRKFNGYRRAGEGGNGILVLPGIDTVDASSVDTSVMGVLHQYYADNQAILGDLFQLFRGDGPRDRFRLKSAHAPAGDYWLFQPAAR